MVRRYRVLNIYKKMLVASGEDEGEQLRSPPLSSLPCSPPLSSVPVLLLIRRLFLPWLKHGMLPPPPPPLPTCFSHPLASTLPSLRLRLASATVHLELMLRCARPRRIIWGVISTSLCGSSRLAFAGHLD